jgi:hypothetical protein
MAVSSREHHNLASVVGLDPDILAGAVESGKARFTRPPRDASSDCRSDKYRR